MNERSNQYSRMDSGESGIVINNNNNNNNHSRRIGFTRCNDSDEDLIALGNSFERGASTRSSFSSGFEITPCDTPPKVATPQVQRKYGLGRRPVFQPHPDHIGCTWGDDEHKSSRSARKIKQNLQVRPSSRFS